VSRSGAISVGVRLEEPDGVALRVAYVCRPAHARDRQLSLEYRTAALLHPVENIVDIRDPGDEDRAAVQFLAADERAISAGFFVCTGALKSRQAAPCSRSKGILLRRQNQSQASCGSVQASSSCTRCPARLGVHSLRQRFISQPVA
jgi:hypothetical protein